MGKQFDIAIPHATLLAIFAAVLALSIPAWLTNTLLLWLFWSFAALLYMAQAPRRDFVQGTLRHPRFTQIYRTPAKWAVDWFWSRYCDESYEGNSFVKTFRHALTWKLYDKALLIAVAYPLWLLIAFWIYSGQDGRLGNSIILPATDFWPGRATILSVIAILILGVAARTPATASRHRAMRQAADWLLILAVTIFAIRGIFIITDAEAIIAAVLIVTALILIARYSGAGAIVSALTFAGAFAVAAVGALAFAVAAVGALVFAVAVASLDRQDKPQLARWLVTLALPLGWVALLIILPWADVSELRRGLFLFLGVLPLINALFDVVSYAVTLTLLRLGLSGRHPFLNGALDLAIAMILFLALGACLVALITAMNALAGTPLFDLGALFDGIRATPSDYYWLYLMMFSTLLPTAMHLALAVLGLQAITPHIIRCRVANLVKASPDNALEATFAPLAVGAIWSVPFLLIGWGFYFCWYYFGGWITSLGWFYLDTLSALSLFLGNG